MKILKAYGEIFELDDADAVFDYLITSLKPVINDLTFFVDWAKVLSNIDDYKIELNILNSLCSSKDIQGDLRNILTKYPEVISAFPLLIGLRKKTIQILESGDTKKWKFKTYTFKKSRTLFDDAVMEDYVKLFTDSGLLDFIQEGKLKSILDYAYGVEVGLDTNARKNRGGNLMEDLVASILSPIAQKLDYKIMAEANKQKLKTEWNIDLPVDKSARRVDFALYNGENLVLIETNFYSGGGSKLKATAGEYIAMSDYWKSNNIEFIWITDGAGWKSTHKPLRETFDHIDYLFNLEMIKNGVIEEVLSSL